ncbi:hypothetical protein [Rhodococcus chondri]|uniref:Ligand-binding SRPBCC domain-containing protein n=1 Tax=Rhodococcus chondri TaxID=3065941 RepID=A0ABU7JRG6_9NOCA|nr:hypothetical protein [Rhodococcus sp. CC-R104]MEE2032484.1 hypothetical protein [Rhodococcus sp. CC-R104]
MTPVLVVEQRSVIAAPTADVWARITDPQGINDELAPLLVMRMPRSARGLTIDNVPPGRPLGRASLLLLGVLPIESDNLSIATIEPGRSFHEKSTMVTLRRWEHERSLTSDAAGCTHLHDRLTFELRAPLARIPYAPASARRIVEALFAHRHQRLVRHFAARSNSVAQRIRRGVLWWACR